MNTKNNEIAVLTNKINKLTDKLSNPPKSWTTAKFAENMDELTRLKDLLAITTDRSAEGVIAEETTVEETTVEETTVEETTVEETTVEETTEETIVVEEVVAPKRRAGRPAGSKNKKTKEIVLEEYDMKFFRTPIENMDWHDLTMEKCQMSGIVKNIHVYSNAEEIMVRYDAILNAIDIVVAEENEEETAEETIVEPVVEDEIVVTENYIPLNLLMILNMIFKFIFNVKSFFGEVANKIIKTTVEAQAKIAKTIVEAQENLTEAFAPKTVTTTISTVNEKTGEINVRTTTVEQKYSPLKIIIKVIVAGASLFGILCAILIIIPLI